MTRNRARVKKNYPPRRRGGAEAVRGESLEFLLEKEAKVKVCRRVGWEGAWEGAEVPYGPLPPQGSEPVG